MPGRLAKAPTYCSLGARVLQTRFRDGRISFARYAFGSSRFSARSCDPCGRSEAVAGLAGLVSWVVATHADRDLFFQDLHVLSGWGPCPSSIAILWQPDAFWQVE